MSKTMTLGTWYKQAFRNGDVSYFFAVKVLKKGHTQGKAYMLYVDKPRAKAKGKQESVWAPDLWTAIPESEVPMNRLVVA